MVRPLSEFCTLPRDGGTCTARFPLPISWGYNPDTRLCERFVYGGCGGNDNRFDTGVQCLSVCQPKGISYNQLNTNNHCRKSTLPNLLKSLIFTSITSRKIQKVSNVRLNCSKIRYNLNTI